MKQNHEISVKGNWQIIECLQNLVHKKLYSGWGEMFFNAFMKV